MKRIAQAALPAAVVILALIVAAMPHWAPVAVRVSSVLVAGWLGTAYIVARQQTIRAANAAALELAKTRAAERRIGPVSL